MPLTAVPDHVAVAVPDIDASLVRWRDDLGGVVQWRFHNRAVFRGAALEFGNGAYLELLAPSETDERGRSTGGPTGFMEDFLVRYGAGVHHMTLKVPDLHEAIAIAADGGLDAVDVDDSDPHWQEAFLRPSQVGSMIVQLAASDRDAQAEAEAEGSDLQATPSGAARLLGPRLGTPDLDAAAAVWTTLGATVTEESDHAVVRWEGQPLTVELVPAEQAGPIGLRFEAASPRPPDATLGAAVLATAG